MSKIVCDVCGTSYPETATQCPICGCVRPSDVNVVAGDTNITEVEQSGTYTYVKGGRFSKSNVRKRNQGQTLEGESQEEAVEQIRKKPTANSDTGLVVAVCVLLLAIISAVIYITLHFFTGVPAQQPAGNNQNTNVETSTVETTLEENVLVPCTGILVSKTSVTLSNVGDTCKLSVTVEPADTTDTVAFASSDDLVATVSEDGLITAVGTGEATITVLCGEVKAECRVVCDIPQEETEESTNGTEENDADQEQENAGTQTSVLELNRDDFTIPVNGTWKLYNGDIPVDQITWTSDRESVAKIENGVVTGVAKGSTTVHAEYNGTKVDCRVHVR